MSLFTTPAGIAAPPKGYMSLTVVGSGASTAIPVIGHVSTDCACKHAIADPNGPNRRSNVSLLVTTLAPTRSDNKKPNTTGNSEHWSGPDTVRHDTFASAQSNAIGNVPVHFTLIDCGKTFRDSYFRILVRHEVRLVDALLLTHDHADAISGLDDLRDLQQMHMVNHSDWIIDRYIPTYLLNATLQKIEERVSYIARNSQLVGPAPTDATAHEACMSKHMSALKAEKGEEGWNNIGVRRSTALQFFTLPADHVVPFHIPPMCKGNDGEQDMPLYSLPVEHGKHYISLGYVFGTGVAFSKPEEREATKDAERTAEREALEGKSCVVYISDVSEVPPAAMAFLDSLVKIDVLYVDCLFSPSLSGNAVHYNIDDTVELVAHLKPRHAFCVGMYCEVEHEVAQGMLRDKLAQLVKGGRLKTGEVETFALAHDGMEIVLPR